MRLLFSLVFVFCLSYTQAQDAGRYTEKEIEAQGLYIKASQKKLLGKYDEAIKLYGDLLEKNPASAPALFDLSRIYLEKGDHENAISYGEKALKKAPKIAWYKESLAEIQYENENYTKSGQYLSELIKGDPKNQGLYNAAINSYRKGKNTDLLLSTIGAMEKVFGTTEFSITETAKILLDQGKNKEALQKAAQLLDLESDNTDYLVLNAELQNNYGSKNKAESLYTRVLQQEPDNSKALVFKARSNKSGDKLSTISSIVNSAGVHIDAKIKALIPYVNKITPEDPKKEELLSLSKQIVTAHPDEAKAYALYGDMLYYSGDNSTAASNYSEALKLDKSVYMIWDQLMNIQMELKDYAALATTSNKALDYYPNQGAPYAYNAIALLHQNNMADAKEMMMEAKIIGSKDENVKYLLSIADVMQEGDDLIEVSKEDLFMKGINSSDSAVIKVLPNGKYLIRVKKGS